MIGPDDVEGWLQLGVPGLLAGGFALMFWLFQRERTEHLESLRKGQELAVEFARTVESMTHALERTKR
jgi:hypothetical protein